MDGGFTAGTMDVVSLIYGFVAVATIAALLRRGRGFWRGPVAEADERLTWAAAFFLVLPVGVLLHELGHAVATWSLGGEVAQISWRVYWGFVVPVGDFGALASWWISLAGNLVSAAFGVALMALAPAVGRARPALGRVLLVAGVMEIAFTLVVYPLMSLDGSFAGDWRTIYDFDLTPLSSSVMLAAHAGALLALWLARRRLSELTWAISAQRQPERTRARGALARDRTDVVAHRQIAQLFLAGGRPQWAAEAAAQGLEDCGEDAELYGVLGASLIQRVCFAEALGPLTRAVEISSATSSEIGQWIHATHGIALVANGRGADALEIFSELEEPAASDPAVQVWSQRARAAAAP